MSTREVMQQALDALVHESWCSERHKSTPLIIEALRAELTKPEPSPAGYFVEYPGNEYARHRFKQFADMYARDVESVPLYRKEDL